MPVPGYANLVEFAHTHKSSILTSEPCLQSVAGAFNSNMHRTLTLAMLPALICIKNLNLWELDQAAKRKEREEEGCRFNKKLEGMTHAQQKEARNNQRKEQWATKQPAFPNLQVYRNGADAVDSRELYIASGMDLLFGNVLLGSWMTFEMMATDLWIAAVNARPKTLAYNIVALPSITRSNPRLNKKSPKLKARKADDKREDDDQKDSSEFRQQEPTIRLKTFAEYGFNISDKVGQFLKEGRRVNFDCLRDICAAYYDTFRNPGDKNRLSQQLNDLFDKFFDDLKALEAMRNLIAHRGSVVDMKFKEELEEHDKKLAQLPEGQPLKVDGDFALKYLMVVDGACSELFHFVDDRLVADKHQTDNGGR